MVKLDFSLALFHCELLKTSKIRVVKNFSELWNWKGIYSAFEDTRASSPTH
jgi:hypothetical protein